MNENSESDDMISQLATTYVFRRRPLSIPGNLRPFWKIGLLVLLLKNCCKSGKSTIPRLHVLSWGVRSAESEEALRNAVTKTQSVNLMLVRYDPFLNRAIDFALGEKLIKNQDGKSVVLTPDGRKFAEELEQNNTSFAKEKQRLAAISFKVTEKFVIQIFGWKE